MIKQIIAMTIKEFKVLLSDAGAFSTLFIMPIAFILVMSIALQGVFDSGSNNNPIDLLVVNQDQGAVAAQIITNLHEADGLDIIETSEGQSITRATAEDMITAGTYSIALVFPADFSEKVNETAGDSQAERAVVSFIIDPAAGSQLIAPVRGLVEGYIEREVSTIQTPILIQQGFDALAASVPAEQVGFIQDLGTQFTLQMDNSMGDAVDDPGFEIQVVSPEKYQSARTPTSAEQNVPGYTIYGVFFIITIISTSLFREKNEGTLRRLQAAPISRAAILMGKLLPYYLVNLIQIALMLAVGMVVFHISLGEHPLALIPLSLATAAAATGMGLLITSLGKTQEQASSLSTILSIVLSALGGLMVPLYVMPDFMQKLAYAIPHAWALSGFLDVIVRGQGINEVMPIVGVMLGYALIFWVVGLRRFRFD